MPGVRCCACVDSETRAYKSVHRGGAAVSPALWLRRVPRFFPVVSEYPAFTARLTVTESAKHLRSGSPSAGSRGGQPTFLIV